MASSSHWRSRSDVSLAQALSRVSLRWTKSGLNLDHDARGTVVFHPSSGQGAIATGVLDPRGRFQLATGALPEVVPGRYQVTVAIVELLPRSEEMEQTGKLMTPARYGSAIDSGLQAMVVPGPNEFKFNLKSEEESCAAERGRVDSVSAGSGRRRRGYAREVNELPRLRTHDEVEWMGPSETASMESVWRLARLLCVVLMCCDASGCGNGLSQVSGVVTLDGEPLRGGSGDTRVTIQFQPASGNGSTAIGLADENGEYTLATGSKDGIPPGEYLVSCSASQLAGAQARPGAPGVRSIVDRKVCQC